ncbi:MAG: 6-phosphofructokinase [Flavobacteriales bacterium]|nr:6-phosphofructokinase [Flavobacteriales bacterium]|tara:strand:+ start:1074 stop:2057 length:984 start_codon:yes stop_codon:yes gene_type:complete
MAFKNSKTGILTSGGDAPGMNAAIRSFVRSAEFNNIEVVGIQKGFQGLIEGSFEKLEMRSVSNILGVGGTFLHSARSIEFLDKKKRKLAYKNLQSQGINSLVVIGGNGSLTGASVFSDEFKIPVIGIPASIDNDIFGTDFSIGYDTALQTIVESVDKIRDTANSHNRLFFIEVMGRKSGNLALNASLASGACFVILPEKDFQLIDLIKRLEENKKRKKESSIVIVAEGNNYGPSYKIAEDLRKVYSAYESKVTILGHIQRGGKPSPFDRILASQLGMAAVEALKLKKYNSLVGLVNNILITSPISDVINSTNNLSNDLYRLNKIISR